MNATAARPSNRPFHVLFLCTHNAARSVIAECVMNRLGGGKFRAYSAGSQPSGKVHPYALELLQKLNYDTRELRSKSWQEFATRDAPDLDFVFTVCDDAANEVCPVWPGQPMSAHWGLPDPSRAEGNEAERRLAFADTHRMLNQRISIFINLPVVSLSKLSLQRRLDEIGRTTADTSRERA
jgi:arsenate reductase